MRPVQITVTIALLFCCNQVELWGQAVNSKQPIKGRVQIDGNGRLPRPLTDAKFDFAIKKTETKLEGNAWSAPGADFIKAEPKTSSLLNNALKGHSEGHDLTATTTRTESQLDEKETPKAEEKKETGSFGDDYYPEVRNRRLSSKKILIRLKRFRSLSETEVVWEAARDACRWLSKGADVTILLDMDAIHAANKNETAGAWYEKNRGSGNERAEKLTTPQDQLTTFVQSGGKLVASERWVKLNYMSHSSLVSGTRLLNEDDMDDLLMDSSYTVIFY